MEGSTAAEGPPPQTAPAPDISALLQPHTPYRREERIQSGVRGESAR